MFTPPYLCHQLYKYVATDTYSSLFLPLLYQALKKTPKHKPEGYGHRGDTETTVAIKYLHIPLRPHCRTTDTCATIPRLVTRVTIPVITLETLARNHRRHSHSLNVVSQALLIISIARKLRESAMQRRGELDQGV